MGAGGEAQTDTKRGQVSLRACVSACMPRAASCVIFAPPAPFNCLFLVCSGMERGVKTDELAELEQQRDELNNQTLDAQAELERKQKHIEELEAQVGPWGRRVLVKP